jgi:hypothetical protein
VVLADLRFGRTNSEMTQLLCILGTSSIRGRSHVSLKPMIDANDATRKSALTPTGTIRMTIVAFPYWPCDPER